MTIQELRIEKKTLETEIHELLINFNKKTDVPITDIILDVTRMSGVMYERDTYLYEVSIEVAL